jgi:hypothetical protein
MTISFEARLVRNEAHNVSRSLSFNHEYNLPIFLSFHGGH